MLRRDWHERLRRVRWRAAEIIAPRRTVRSRGLNFTLQCDNWVTHYRWKSYNTKEPETLDWIDTKLGSGDVFFDVGANIGVYAIYAALRHPWVRVITFEPEYANLHLLRDNIVGNCLQDRVEVYAIALSNCSGVSRLHVQDFTPGAALHTESRETIDLTRTGQRVVWREGIYTLTLDRFCEETGLQPTAIKIDVDGTEAEVLEGGKRTLCSSGLRSVLIEQPQDEQAHQICERLLLDSGFRREWQGPLGKSLNEVWVRETSSR